MRTSEEKTSHDAGCRGFALVSSTSLGGMQFYRVQKGRGLDRLKLQLAWAHVSFGWLHGREKLYSERGEFTTEIEVVERSVVAARGLLNV